MAIVPPGVLWNSDELAVELSACLWAEFQADPNAMLTSRIARLERLLGKLGLTPADRAGLEIQETEPNERDAF